MTEEQIRKECNDPDFVEFILNRRDWLFPSAHTIPKMLLLAFAIAFNCGRHAERATQKAMVN